MALTDLTLPLSFMTGSMPGNATSFSAFSNLPMLPIFAHHTMNPVIGPMPGMVVMT